MKQFPVLVFLVAALSMARAADSTAFLGVATRPLSAEESAEADLPRGVGLRVEEVVAGSPAAAELVYGDILHRLDEQILVNPRQLAVLVRMREPGEEVTLKVRRGGEEIEAALKLGERPLIEQARPAPSGPRGAPAPQLGGPGPRMDMDPFERMREMEERLRELMERMPEPGAARPAPADAAVHSRQRMEWRENGDAMVLEVEDGDARATVTEDGDVVFEGPVNTPAQREKVPERWRERLEEAEFGTSDPDGTLL